MAYDMGQLKVVDGGRTDDAKDDDNRVGLADLSEEEIVKQVLEWWKEGTSASVEKRKRRMQAHKMHDNDQWEQQDRQARGKRPTLTFNMMQSIVAAVEGQEKNNRQEMKFYGRGMEDEPAAERWTKLLKWVVEANDGEFELSDQFRENVISGEAWIVPTIDYFDDPEGLICLECVDNDEIVDDPLSVKPTGTDARYRMRIKMLTEDEGEGLWPGKFKTAIAECLLHNEMSAETDGKGYPDIYLTPEKGQGPKRYDSKGKTWAVIQCWWWQIEEGWVVVNEETGLLEELTEEEYQEKKAARREEQRQALNAVLSGGMMAGAMPGMDGMMPPIQIPRPLQAQKRPLKKVYEAFVVYDAVMEVGPIPEKLKVFPAVPMRGIRRKSKNDWVGLIDGIIDAQKQHNVEQSVLMELQQLMPKSSWMGPKGSFHNKRDWETGVAQPGKLLEYDARKGKPEPITPPQIPRHLMELAFSRPQSMREISGVNVELTGIRQGSDAGVVMEQRAKAAQTVLAGFFDNARRSKKLLGKILLAFMQKHLSPGRQIRILGPDGAQLVDVTPDMLVGRYDLSVDETESTVNDRVATLNIMQTTLPTMMKAGVPIPPSFVDLLPIPVKLRDEMKTMISWHLAQSGALPPPGWKPGMPVPPPALPAPGGVAPPPADPATV